jgi:hypothetical protein
MDGGYEWRERRCGPPDERHEWAGEPVAEPSDVASHADAGARFRETERDESDRKEEGEEKERDAAELALET